MDEDDKPSPKKKEKCSPPPKAPPKSTVLPAAVPPLPRGWKSSFDEDGVIFYYNQDRSKVQYEEPSPTSPHVQESSPPPPPPRAPKVLPQQPPQRQPQPAARPHVHPPAPMRLTQLQGGPSSSTSGRPDDVLPSERRESVRGLQPLEMQRLRQIASLRSQLLYATSEETKMRIAGLLGELELAHDQGWT